MDPATLVIVGGVGIATALVFYECRGKEAQKKVKSKGEKERSKPQQQQQKTTDKVGGKHWNED